MSAFFAASDGIGKAANPHRLVGNLFDVELLAIANLQTAEVGECPKGC